MQNLVLTALIVVYLYFFSPIYNTVDPKLQPFLDEYVAAAQEVCPTFKVNYHRFRMVFSERMNEDLLGSASYNNFSDIVYISKQFFDSEQNETFRKGVIFHELSHAFLDIDHVDSYFHYMTAFGDPMIDEKELIKQVKEDWVKGCGYE